MNNSVIEKIIFDSIDIDYSNAVTWYLLALYAKSHSEVFVSNFIEEYLERKILNNWNTIENKYKNLLTNEAGRLKFIGDYPSEFVQIQKIFGAIV